MSKVADEMQITLPLKRFNQLIEASEKVIHFEAKLDQVEKLAQSCRGLYLDILNQLGEIKKSL